MARKPKDIVTVRCLSEPYSVARACDQGSPSVGSYYHAEVILRQGCLGLYRNYIITGKPWLSFQGVDLGWPDEHFELI